MRARIAAEALDARKRHIPPTYEPAPAPRRSPLPPTRVKGALSPQDTDGLPVPTPAVPVPAPTPAPEHHTLTIRVPVSRERLYVFAALAAIEQRPVEDVLQEGIANLAAHLSRTRHALILDEQDAAGLNAYLDRLEAQERDEDEARARAATTSAMRLAAIASAMREAYPLDDEEADFRHRCVGAGYVEITTAQEGN